MSNTLKQDVAVLKEQVSDLRENHVPHLQTGIDKLSDKFDKGVWLILTTLTGVVVTLVLTLWK